MCYYPKDVLIKFIDFCAIYWRFKKTDDPIIAKYEEPRLGEPILGESIDQQTDKAILGVQKTSLFVILHLHLPTN